ncbi:MAG: RHS repeat-associated core domain-containing protein [Bacteroidales bacterium]|nr:RHS repeat-associated core domain-containing protein [Bacteroidales bacterium]
MNQHITYSTIPLPTFFADIYTFSAKEKDSETGLSYFGSRYYSSDLSIWLSVDPMASKYPSLSPYVYCANNPVRVVDPDGEEIDPESMQAWNTLKSDITGRKNFLKPFAILNKITHGVLCNKEADRYNSLCNTLNSMEDLEYSDQLYRLGTVEGSVGNVTLNDDESLTINYCNTANFIHEMTHCVQFERGDIGFFKGKGAQAFTDVYDEIESYTAQAAYDPTTIPNYSKRYTPLTPQWVKHMRYSDGGYIYSNCGLIRYNGNATASDMNRIFPNNLVPFDFDGKLREQPGTYFK